jgi:hypothetical protein
MPEIDAKAFELLTPSLHIASIIGEGIVSIKALLLISEFSCHDSITKNWRQILLADWARGQAARPSGY